MLITILIIQPFVKVKNRVDREYFARPQKVNLSELVRNSAISYFTTIRYNYTMFFRKNQLLNINSDIKLYCGKFNAAYRKI